MIDVDYSDLCYIFLCVKANGGLLHFYLAKVTNKLVNIHFFSFFIYFLPDNSPPGCFHSRKSAYNVNRWQFIQVLSKVGLRVCLNLEPVLFMMREFNTFG